ncbi:hypothetical protein SADUNF_Sadunf11G0119600 [Salix dunnii]|uniref:Cupin type-1 domain-containing protein n=1 Tax=Salix dunnii TaxID=1413687 RepID=A0A835MQW4_9ROSI|nr:hypothetical protein SADUNF_Sadunf11G0119600 [Salix dunnii]
MASSILFFGFLALSFSYVIASDPSSLQDFCVADETSNGTYKLLKIYKNRPLAVQAFEGHGDHASGLLNSGSLILRFVFFMAVIVNGLACKDLKMVHAGNTSNAVGSRVTTVNVALISGLNTLGISLVRIDYAPWGINPPHTHPRGSEILTVIEGSLEVGFVASNPENRVITKLLQKGDVFVFPIGLIHFQRNVGNGDAVAIAALSSQNAGVITIANAVFGSTPVIPGDILVKAFQLDRNVINHLQSNFVLLLCLSIRSEPTSGFLCGSGLACKDLKSVQASDFSFSGLHMPGNTSNAVGSSVTAVNVVQIPGLNTLGISFARIDYAPSGINPPHTHPRASEILTVLEGSLEVGFVTSNPGNRLITKVLQKGDVFVFPINLVHFQRNVGTSNAVALAALSSQNPGVITIANAVFGSNPDIPSDILAKAFQLDKNAVDFLKSKF